MLSATKNLKAAKVGQLAIRAERVIDYLIV
jgi:hypothetical protein